MACSKQPNRPGTRESGVRGGAGGGLRCWSSPLGGGGRAGGRDDLGRTAAVLGDHGYEPRVSEREICLANCPFDRLAAEHTNLVCGMNLALIDGVLAGLDTRGLTAELAPQPGFCCVKVRGDGETTDRAAAG